MLTKDFDKKAFNVQFDEMLDQLKSAEKVTKAILSTASRILLDQLHFDEDIQPINRLLDVLTPVNKKVAIHFFSAFSGFTFKKDEMKFNKKDKKSYEAKKAAASLFLDDPLNNIWSWADRHIEVEPKPFDPAQVTKYLVNALNKADKQGKRMELLRAILNSGISGDELIEALDPLPAMENHVGKE